MSELRRVRSGELDVRSPSRSGESEPRQIPSSSSSSSRHQSDDRRAISPGPVNRREPVSTVAARDSKLSSSSSGKKAKKETPTSSPQPSKGREKEKEKDRGSAKRPIAKSPERGITETFFIDHPDYDTSEDLDIDDLDAEFKFEAEDDDPEPNVFTSVANPFLNYLESGRFSDCTLILPNGAQYRVHRLILAYSSLWFYNELQRTDPNASSKSLQNSDGIMLQDGSQLGSDQQEPQTDSPAPPVRHPDPTINSPFPDEANMFPLVLKWMYTGNLTITPQNCVLLSVLADRYQMPILQKLCRAYISANLQHENALDILLEAVKLKTESLISRAVAIVARNFLHLKSDKFRNVAYDVFIRVLQHKKLAVTTGEFALFKVVCDYFAAHQTELTEAQVYALFSNVRFRLMSFEELEEANRTLACLALLFPWRSLTSWYLLYRLMSFECSAEELEKRTRQLPLRLQPRPKLSLVFDYNKENSEFFHGIVRWIGTKEGTEPWKNPHITGRVKVHSSSLAKGSRQILVDKTPNQVWTNDTPSSWFSIDFGPHRRITPTYYSLRHGGNYKGDTLRTWDLQGSIDGVTWKTIKRHSNDKNLNAPYAIASWPVEGCKESFRFFRILQTSHNSSGHNFLVLSGIEFFGRLDTA